MKTQFIFESQSTSLVVIRSFHPHLTLRRHWWSSGRLIFIFLSEAIDGHSTPLVVTQLFHLHLSFISDWWSSGRFIFISFSYVIGGHSVQVNFMILSDVTSYEDDESRGE
ncbi:hypothetical protein DICVIV_09092 [Dictyocaulus viviparus]|uniref:Uncharacterized protein n=1 Tax=Dictyocaulus viviparus TaxID=29172 RepID=A0A0D8XJV2_DICVI|nr:hypothetical protein DICVIV_09092 [Dictyocaulus viviparus]